jgi:hypothetical protein
VPIHKMLILLNISFRDSVGLYCLPYNMLMVRTVISKQNNAKSNP